jgi:hypothetical protein
MFCVSEGLAGHYALASRVEPEVWGVLPLDQAFTSTNSDSVRSVFQQSNNGCPFSMPPITELYRGFFHPIFGIMPSRERPLSLGWGLITKNEISPHALKTI